MIHFCGLGYSRPDGADQRPLARIERLTWEPEFYRYVRDAFAPVGLMIDAFAEEYPSGPDRQFPVIVINDLDRDGRARCDSGCSTRAKRSRKKRCCARLLLG